MFMLVGARIISMPFHVILHHHNIYLCLHIGVRTIKLNFTRKNINYKMECGSVTGILTS